MPKLRVFVSSTAYDLGAVREQLRAAISSLGHVPVLSEYPGFLFDPDQHTHKSCVAELRTCDLVVLIIGTRYGSEARPEFVGELDPSRLGVEDSSQIKELLKDRKLSVTQLEALTAFEEGIPVFVYAHRDMVAERRMFQSNEELARSGNLTFPSGCKSEQIAYIADFLTYIESRVRGNAVVEFGTIEDITTSLRSQWSALFQRLLTQGREAPNQSGLFAAIAEKIDDLKSTFVATIPDADAKKVATGVLQFRLLLEVLAAVSPHYDYIMQEDSATLTFTEALERFGVNQVAVVGDPLANQSIFSHSTGHRVRERTYFLLQDGRVLESRWTFERVMDFATDWNSFMKLTKEERELIANALTQGPQSRAFTRAKEPWDQVLQEADLVMRLENGHFWADRAGSPRSQHADDGQSRELKFE